MKISEQEVSRLLALLPSSLLSSQGEDEAPMLGIGAPAAGLHGARVEASSNAQEITRIKSLIDQLPDERVDRVEALRSQIAGGSYHVSGEDIADLIIRRTLADNTAL